MTASCENHHPLRTTPAAAIHQSLLIIHHSVLLVVTLLVSLSVQQVFAQSARVQFINGSTYEEAGVVDVYVNGERRLDDLARGSGTPFEDYPAGRPLLFQVTPSIAHGPNRAFYARTLTLKPNETYVVIASGDPMKREGEPAFELFVYEGARESSSDTPEFAQYLLFNNTPKTTITTAVRGVPQDINPRIDHQYGKFIGYLLGAKMQWDVDFMLAGTDSVIASIVQDFEEWGNRPGVSMGIGDFTVLADGTAIEGEDNVAIVQFINDSPHPSVDTVDVYVDGVLTVDDLAFREASPLLELPSGLRDNTAPDLKIDVTSSTAPDNADPVYSTVVKLIFGRAYVSVLAGDPSVGEGSFPLALYWSDRGQPGSVTNGELPTLLFHGAPGVQGVVIGIESASGHHRMTSLFFGGFENATIPAADTTLFVLDGQDRRLIARFDANLASMGLVDSTLVVVTSATKSRNGLEDSGDGALALLAAPPSGGKLIAFPATVPPPWWQTPWMLLLMVAGIAVVAFGASQLRVRRLEAKARELSQLVAERTRELQAEKEKTEEQARRLAELDEAKNRFFANISHEFRTPLTLILGPVQDMLDGSFGPLSGPAITQHRLIRRNARRLLRLVNQLLDLSRLESGRMTLSPEPGDLVAFLRELHRVFTPLAERRQVTFTFEPKVSSLRGRLDWDAIEKVFTNLISNALKFTPEAGKVTMQLAVMTKAAAAGQENNPDSSRIARTAVVAVTDTGPGIPEEQLDRIFERFHQADSSISRRHEGSGVGLTLARELAELQGGSLVAESTVGKGSVFTVSLPLEEVDVAGDGALPTPHGVLFESPLLVADEARASFETDGTASVQAKILVVEDNPDVREYLRAHLAQKYRLLEADNGEAGLEIARLQKPDLILSDVMMPVMDGFEMCRRIKAIEELRDIPVIMLTAKADEKDTLEGLEIGAEDYISKPFNIREVEARIRNFVSVRRDLRSKYSKEIVVKPGDIVITAEEEIFLDAVLESVNLHLGDSNFSVEWLAEEVGTSRRNLERKIEATTGQTPADLIRTLRLQRASQLLRAHAGSVAEIAYSVGFNSPQHFSTVFKQKYGEAPTEHAGRATVRS